MENDAYYMVWYIVYAVIMIPTVFGNGLILHSVAKFPRLRSNIHILIANLAISDLIVGAVLIPIDTLSEIFDWKSNNYVCLATIGVFVLSLCSSCYNLLLISIERFIVICFPFRARTMLTKQKLLLMISFGWILTAINSTMPLYGVNTISNSTTECAYNDVLPEAYRIYSDWLLICGLIVNFLFYMIVVRTAITRMRVRNSIKGNSNFNIHAKAKLDLYRVITMVIVLGTFVICWLPYATVSVMITFWDMPILHFVKMCTLLLGLFNSSTNWLIYGYRNTEFRKAFKSILKCKFCNKDDSRSTSFEGANYTTGSGEF